MVRTVCSNGLGQAAVNLEDPSVLAQDYQRALQIFGATTRRIPSGSADLANRAIILGNLFSATARDMAERRFRDARIKLNTIYGLVTDLAKRVGEATTSGKIAQAQAEAGSSFLNQLLATLGLIPEGAIYRPDVPGGAAADATATALKWALPIGAGVVLLLLLRR